jgi:hypothetical protein
MEGIVTMHDTDAAVEKVIASISDEELAARYPDRTHFISASSPAHGEMASRALSDGDSVAIVYSDGHELLIRPEEIGGIVALFLLLAAFFLRHRHKNADVIQLPPRARIEARDATGHPIAA